MLVKARFDAGLFQVISRKYFLRASDELQKRVRGCVGYSELSNYGVWFQSLPGPQLWSKGNIFGADDHIDTKSLICVQTPNTLHSNEKHFQLGEFAAMLHMFEKHSAGSMMKDAFCIWKSHPAKKAWLEWDINNCMHSKWLALRMWQSNTRKLSLRKIMTLRAATKRFHRARVRERFAYWQRIWAVFSNIMNGATPMLQTTPSAYKVMFARHVQLNRLREFFGRWKKFCETQLLVEWLGIDVYGSDVPEKPPKKTRRAGAKKRKKKQGEETAAAGEASSTMPLLPVVDEDEELVLEANEASVVVQNLSELAISVDAALDDGNDADDAVSVVESSLASALACVVCFERPRERAAIPCGHKCFCGICADRFACPGAKCPMCRANIMLVCEIFG